ncbi:MAG: hypothetical protein ACTSVI_04125 [Promethearchaeota archaeon]
MKELKKEINWKIKLDGKIIILRAIEDSTNPDPDVYIIVEEPNKKIKINIDITKERFLNLIGVMDSFSQVALGVEPKLPEEGYMKDTIEEAPEPQQQENEGEDLGTEEMATPEGSGTQALANENSILDDENITVNGINSSPEAEAKVKMSTADLGGSNIQKSLATIALPEESSANDASLAINEEEGEIDPEMADLEEAIAKMSEEDLKTEEKIASNPPIIESFPSPPPKPKKPITPKEIAFPPRFPEPEPEDEDEDDIEEEADAPEWDPW